MKQKQLTVYFEKQGFFSLLCGMHSINNILGKSVYESSSMNEICYQLSDALINPHKHIFGGDYDVNVLIIALQRQNCTIKWHDRRNKSFVIRQNQQQGQLVGFLINKYMGSNIFNKIFRTSPRHWFCIRKNNTKYYLLDSKQDQALSFNKSQVQKYINELLVGQNEDNQHNQIIQVYAKIK